MKCRWRWRVIYIYIYIYIHPGAIDISDAGFCSRRAWLGPPRCHVAVRGECTAAACHCRHCRHWPLPPPNPPTNPNTGTTMGIRTKFELLELSILSSSNSNLAFPLHENASPLPPKAPRTNQLGFLGPWVPMGAPLLPPLLLCPTPEYRPSRSPCQRGAWKARICQYQPPQPIPLGRQAKGTQRIRSVGVRRYV